MDTEKLTGSLVGELLLGELPEWYVGVCRVIADGDEIVVYDEDDHGFEVISTDVWTESPIDGEPVKDLQRIAESANRAIQREHREL